MPASEAASSVYRPICVYSRRTSGLYGYDRRRVCKPENYMDQAGFVCDNGWDVQRRFSQLWAVLEFQWERRGALKWETCGKASPASGAWKSRKPGSDSSQRQTRSNGVCWYKIHWNQCRAAGWFYRRKSSGQILFYDTGIWRSAAWRKNCPPL